MPTLTPETADLAWAEAAEANMQPELIAEQMEGWRNYDLTALRECWQWCAEHYRQAKHSGERAYFALFAYLIEQDAARLKAATL